MTQKRLLLVVVTLMLPAAAPGDQPEARCKVAGAVFGVDPFGSTILVKDTTGYIVNVTVSPKTIVLKLPVAGGETVAPVTLKDVSTGDLLCADGPGAETATQISVVSRLDVQRAQREFLAGWVRNSIYGVISSIDTATRSLIVTSLPPSSDPAPVRVTVPESAQLRSAPMTARRVADTTSFRFDELQVGDQVYVRGARQYDGPEIKASLVMKGGYRAVLGTLVNVQALTSTLEIREFGTGRALQMKVLSSEVYRTTENVTHPMRLETKAGILLVPVGFADLQIGDAVLIVGKTSDQADQGDGLVVVTKFGTFGVLPQDAQGNVSWLLR